MAEDVKNIHVTDEMLNQATQNYMKSLEGPEQLQIKLLKENAEEVKKGILAEVKKLQFGQLRKENY